MTPDRSLSTINLQYFPGRGGVVSHHGPTKPADRLAHHRGLVLVMAGEGGAPEDRFGLGAFLVITGRTVHRAGLVIPGGRPEVAEALKSWCAARSFETLSGSRAWECQTAAEFFDYRTGLFTRRIYTDGGQPVLIAADLGRTLGLCAEEPPDGETWPDARGNFWRGGVSLHVSGWADPDDRPGKGVSLRAVSPHRPGFRLKPRGAHGWLAQFGAVQGDLKAGKPDPRAGKRNSDGTAWHGRFLDVIQAANVLDGLDSGELADHFAVFDFERLDLPPVVSLDASGAAELAHLVEAVHQLALRLDDEAAQWLTTPRQRAEEAESRLDLGALYTPAGIATAIVCRAGVIAPLVKFPTPDDTALRRWMGAHKGGWLSAELAGAGVFPAADIDVHSAYPACASLLGWWDLMTAAELREEDALDEVRALCEQAATGAVSSLLLPETWHRLGFTLCEMILHDEVCPVEAPDKDYPEGHSGMRPVRCAVPLPFTWPDVVNAALLSGHVPEIVSAIRLSFPERQSGLRARLPLYGGTVLGLGDDPAVTLVRIRDAAKARGDTRLAAELRIVVNALAYGKLAQIDQTRTYDRSKRKWLLGEKATEHTYPPIAASVTAGCRLLVGIAEHLVTEAGGTVASRDTDGLLLVASPDGGTVRLLDGREVGAISWPALDDVRALCDSLCQFDNGSRFFKCVREHNGRPLYGRVGGIKRWAMATLDDDGDLLEVVEWREHALAGSVVDPLLLPGFHESGTRHWTREVWALGFRRDIAQAKGRAQPLASWSWEVDGPFPCIEREQVFSPARIAELAKRGLKVRPGSYLVAGLTRSGNGPIALDPGGDLSDWRSLDWRGARGEQVSPSVRTAHVARLDDLDSLSAKALRWLEPRPLPDGGLVIVDRIAWVTKAGTLLEARLAGDGSDTCELRPEYDTGELLTYLGAKALELGERRFAAAAGVSRSAAKRLRDGKPIRPATAKRAAAGLKVRLRDTPTCALDGCEHPVWSQGSHYCSCAWHSSHQGIAADRRRRARLRDRLSTELGERARDLGADDFARRYAVTHCAAEALRSGEPLSLRELQRIAARVDALDTPEVAS